MLLHFTILLRKRLLPLVSDGLGKDVPVHMPQALPVSHLKCLSQSSFRQLQVPLHGNCEPRRSRYLFDRASLLLMVEDAQEQLRLLSLQEAYHLLVRPSGAISSGTQGRKTAVPHAQSPPELRTASAGIRVQC